MSGFAKEGKNVWESCQGKICKINNKQLKSYLSTNVQTINIKQNYHYISKPYGELKIYLRPLKQRLCKSCITHKMLDIWVL
jgi:hypothetical protein